MFRSIEDRKRKLPTLIVDLYGLQDENVFGRHSNERYTIPQLKEAIAVAPWLLLDELKEFYEPTTTFAPFRKTAERMDTTWIHPREKDLVGLILLDPAGVYVGHIYTSPDEDTERLNGIGIRESMQQFFCKKEKQIAFKLFLGLALFAEANGISAIQIKSPLEHIATLLSSLGFVPVKSFYLSSTKSALDRLRAREPANIVLIDYGCRYPWSEESLSPEELTRWAEREQKSHPFVPEDLPLSLQKDYDLKKILESIEQEYNEEKKQELIEEGLSLGFTPDLAKWESEKEGNIEEAKKHYAAEVERAKLWKPSKLNLLQNDVETWKKFGRWASIVKPYHWTEPSVSWYTQYVNGLATQP